MWSGYDQHNLPKMFDQSGEFAPAQHPSLRAVTLQSTAFSLGQQVEQNMLVSGMDLTQALKRL
jgi:hypothetical protein